LSEVISLHVLSSFGSSILTFLISHALLESLFFDFFLFDFILFLLFLLGEHCCLRLKDSKLIVLRSVLLNFIVKHDAILLQSLHIVCESFKLTLSRHWLLKKQLDPLQSFSFIVQLSAQNLIVDLSVFPCFSSKVVKHFVGAKILSRDFFAVNKFLLDSENLLLIVFNHVGKLSFFFIQFSILFLLLSKLRSGFEESLEVLFVTLIFEQVDLRKQLFLLLFKL